MNASLGNFNSLFRTLPTPIPLIALAESIVAAKVASSQLPDVINQMQAFANSASRVVGQYRSIAAYVNERYQEQVNGVTKAMSLALPVYRGLDSWLKEPFPPYTNAGILEKPSRAVEDKIGLLKPLSGKGVCGNNLFDHEELVELLRLSNFDLSLYHYQEAIDTFESGFYAASNAQCRTFLESFVTLLSFHVTGKKAGSFHVAIGILRDDTYITEPEFRILKEFWSISHTDGAHPGYSDYHKSKSRLLIVTGIAISIISKLEDPRLMNC